MEEAIADRLVRFYDHIVNDIDSYIGHAFFKDARDLATIRMAWVHKVLPFIIKDNRHDPEKVTRITEEFNAAFPPPRMAPITGVETVPKSEQPLETPPPITLSVEDSTA